ncbi:hypothetical protein KEM55_006765 [Ascosphaera atra]|nr:hypothetical protein KEM55_006765 [Ascosphaera atra]
MLLHPHHGHVLDDISTRSHAISMDDNKIAPTQSKFDENYGEVEAAKESRGDIHDLDAAAAFLATHGGLDPLSPEEEKKMLRKIDWCLLPMLLITATLGATDKVALSTAAIYGLEDGTFALN